MIDVEPAGCRIVAITFFGHGQRDDFCCAIGETRVNLLAFGREKQNFAHAPDNAPLHARRTFFHRRIETILRRHPVAHVGAAQAHAANAPCTALLCQRVVGVDRLMGAVKCTDAEMDDAGADAARIVRRPRNRRWNAIERGERQDRHDRSPIVTSRLAGVP